MSTTRASRNPHLTPNPPRRERGITPFSLKEKGGDEGTARRERLPI